MNLLAINTVGDELEASAEFCRSEGLGIEVTEFAFPDNLDGDLGARVEGHIKATQGISPLISHGPFLDLVATSPDPAIVEVARRRHETALQASSQIGASLYVAHTNFNPLIRGQSYQDDWLNSMLDFWLPLADFSAEHGMVICFENVWEPGPEIQAELISTADHPSLQASFDNGHALLYSDEPAKHWIETLGSTLAHCHLHDNNGQLDEHKPIGEGQENWPELMAALRRYSPQAILVAESDRLEKNRESIERLKSF